VHARRRPTTAGALVGSLCLALGAGGCTRPEITVIEATYGATCGATAGNLTGAAARACDGRSDCTFPVDRRQLDVSAPGCAADVRVTWRCSPEESVRTATLGADVPSPPSIALECVAPAPKRIDVLDAAAGRTPIPGLTAAVIERCAGQAACTLTVAGLAPLRAVAAADPDLRVHWRCEGEMTARETRVPAGGDTRLACD
jgi:hypothetical protein